MKKKTLCLFIVALIVANVFFSKTPTQAKDSECSLVLLVALADGTGENDPPDPPDPGGEYPPTRSFPSDWSQAAIPTWFFN